VSTYDAGPRFTPYELAKLLRQPPPTPEQAAVVAAPPAPLLVVAGAGSGKTETMAARVVWLVANGYVPAEQVLGLTFTRKAAGELAHRVRTRLGQLRRRLGDDDVVTGEPTVSTYHAFAARVLTEHGVRAGYEPAARLLSEAARWQLVDELVRTYDGDMSGVPFAPSTVTDAVLALTEQLSEHLVTPDEVARWVGRFNAEVRGRPGRVYAKVQQALERQAARLPLLPLLRRFEQRKRDLEAIDFGDQVARAARLARDHPEVGEIERDRFRVVMLDEYQDTSHAQVVLLHSLFGSGHPVTAVGDPCQSIYGWRGASAGTLDRFPGQFRHAGGAEAPVRQLTTSWRNRPEILTVANQLAVPLHDAGARVATLTAARRTAEPVDGRTVACALLETYVEEAEWIADQVATAWDPATRGIGADPPTTAVLIRRREQIPPVEAALRARGLPVEVVGLGGLLDTPEVRDVVCTLRVLADPADGGSLVRLLTGARWRIGPRDLVALHRRARQIAAARREDAGGGRGDPAAAPEIVPDRLDEATLSEALDDLGDPSAYSEAGHARLSAYAAELAGLRRRLDQPLPDLVAEVERTTCLDVEVAVRAGAPDAGGGLARSHLDALGEVAARFSAEAPGATLPAFLAYLAAAEEEERGLTPGEVDVVPGAVQILTAHAAKGLEWDVVAVAGLTRQVWPAPPKGSDHYLQGVGVLPFPLRGDAGGLPALALDGVPDQQGVERAREAFEAAWRAHDEREERRLTYVAVTRARRLLLCSGYWWGGGVRRPRGPSVFLEEIAQRCRAGAGVVERWVDPPTDGADNPTDALVAEAVWPADPLGGRRAAVEEAAAMVRSALADGATRAEEWAQEVDLLLAERQRARASAAVEVALPEQLSVSQLVALRRDPQALARSLRRPMPARPDPYARRGTAFHTWLERRFGADRLLDLDELPGAADTGAAGDEALAELQRAFLDSEWADRVPVQVEVPFATGVGGLVVRGRMDAVFRDTDGTFDVVDWKTGRRPDGAAARAAAVQLAAYRLAWAALAGVPVSQVRAAFHYVAENVTVRPADLLDADGLAALVTGLPVARSGGGTTGRTTRRAPAPARRRPAPSTTGSLDNRAVQKKRSTGSACGGSICPGCDALVSSRRARGDTYCAKDTTAVHGGAGGADANDGRDRTRAGMGAGGGVPGTVPGRAGRVLSVVSARGRWRAGALAGNRVVDSGGEDARVEDRGPSGMGQHRVQVELAHPRVRQGEVGHRHDQLHQRIHVHRRRAAVAGQQPRHCQLAQHVAGLRGGHRQRPGGHVGHQLHQGPAGTDGEHRAEGGVVRHADEDLHAAGGDHLGHQHPVHAGVWAGAGHVGAQPLVRLGRGPGRDVEPYATHIGLVHDVGGDDLERDRVAEVGGGGGGLGGGADEVVRAGGHPGVAQQLPGRRFGQQPGSGAQTWRRRHGRPGRGLGAQPGRPLGQRLRATYGDLDAGLHRHAGVEQRAQHLVVAAGVHTAHQHRLVACGVGGHRGGRIPFLFLQRRVEPGGVAAQQSDHHQLIHTVVGQQGLRCLGEAQRVGVGGAGHVDRVAHRGVRTQQRAQPPPGRLGQLGQAQVRRGGDGVGGDGGVPAAIGEDGGAPADRSWPTGQRRGDRQQLVFPVHPGGSGAAQRRAGDGRVACYRAGV
jgi:DNA helicase II / ATP-dependent DNA helicase PcrA